MRILFDPTTATSVTNVYIHCESAYDFYDVDKKTCTDHFHDTEWSSKIKEWRDKGYVHNWDMQTMPGRTGVIVLLSFIGGFTPSEFIREVNEYFLGYDSHGVYKVDFKSVYEIEKDFGTKDVVDDND